MAEIRGNHGIMRRQGWLHDHTQTTYGSADGIMAYNRDSAIRPPSNQMLDQTTDAGRDDIDRYSLQWTNEIWDLPHEDTLVDQLVQFVYTKQTGPRLEITTRRWTGPIWQIHTDPRRAPTVPTVEEIKRVYEVMLASGSAKMPASYDWYAPDALYTSLFKHVVMQLQSSWLRLVERTARGELLATMPTLVDVGASNMAEDEIEKLTIDNFGVMNAHPESIWTTLLSSLSTQFQALRTRLNIPLPDGHMVTIIPAAPVVREALIPTLQSKKDLEYMKLPKNMLDLKLQIGVMRALRTISLHPAPGTHTTGIVVNNIDSALQIYSALPVDGTQTDPWIIDSTVALYARVPAGSTGVSVPSKARGNTEYPIDELMLSTGLWPKFKPENNLDDSRKRLFYSAANPNERYNNAEERQRYSFSDKRDKNLAHFSLCLAGSPIVVDSPSAAVYFAQVVEALVQAECDTPAKFAALVTRFDQTLGSADELSNPHRAATAVFDSLGMLDRDRARSLKYSDGKYLFDSTAFGAFCTSALDAATAQRARSIEPMATSPHTYAYDYPPCGNTEFYKPNSVAALKHAANLASVVDRSNTAFTVSRYNMSKSWLCPAMDAFLAGSHSPDRIFGTRVKPNFNTNITLGEAETAFDMLKTLSFWSGTMDMTGPAQVRAIITDQARQDVIYRCLAWNNAFQASGSTFKQVVANLSNLLPGIDIAELKELYTARARLQARLESIGNDITDDFLDQESDEWEALNDAQKLIVAKVVEDTEIVKRLLNRAGILQPDEGTFLMTMLNPGFIDSHLLQVLDQKRRPGQAVRPLVPFDLEAMAAAHAAAIQPALDPAAVPAAIIAYKDDPTSGYATAFVNEAKTYIDAVRAAWAAVPTTVHVLGATCAALMSSALEARFVNIQRAHTVPWGEKLIALAETQEPLRALAESLDDLLVAKGYSEAILRTGGGAGVGTSLRNELARKMVIHNAKLVTPAATARPVVNNSMRDVTVRLESDMFMSLDQILDALPCTKRRLECADANLVMEYRADNVIRNSARIGVFNTPIDAVCNNAFMALLGKIYGSREAAMSHIETYAVPDPTAGNLKYLNAENIGILLLGLGRNNASQGADERAEYMIGKLLGRQAAELASRDNHRLGRWGLAFLLGGLPPVPGVFKMLQHLKKGAWFDMTLVHVLAIKSNPAFYVPARCLKAIVSELLMREDPGKLWDDQQTIAGLMRFFMVNVDQLGLQITHAYIRKCQRLGRLVRPSEFVDAPEGNSTGFVVVDDFDNDRSSLKDITYSTQALDQLRTAADPYEMRSISLGTDFINMISRGQPGTPSLKKMIPLEATIFNQSIAGATVISGCKSSEWISL